MLACSLLSTTLVAAQQATTGGALISVTGEAVITRSSGQTEIAKTGDQVNAGDRLAVPSTGGALIGYSDGSQVGLQSRTTVDFKQADKAPDGSTVVTGDVSRGTVTAETPSNREATIRLTSEASKAVALLKQGDVAFRLDESTGNVSVACDQASDRVFFPYEDMRVPCEQRIVRTFTSDGDIVDSSAGPGSLLSAVVDQGGDRRGTGIQPGGQTEQRAQAEEERSDEEDDKPVPIASPIHLSPVPVTPSCTRTGPSESGAPGSSTISVTQQQISGSTFLYTMTVTVTGGQPNRELEAFIFFTNPLLAHQVTGSFRLDSSGNGTFTGTTTQTGPASLVDAEVNTPGTTDIGPSTPRRNGDHVYIARSFRPCS